MDMSVMYLTMGMTLGHILYSHQEESNPEAQAKIEKTIREALNFIHLHFKEIAGWLIVIATTAFLLQIIKDMFD